MPVVDHAEALDRMSRARTHLLLQEPFWGTLAMHLALAPRTDIPTMQTNGVVLQYNPDFVCTLPEAILEGVIAHEVSHCALGHPWRRGGRDPREWNEACDFVTNEMLLKAGFTLPDNILRDPSFEGMSAEAVYSKRRRQQPQQPPQPEPEDDPQPDDEDDQDSPAPDDSGDDSDGDDSDPGDGDGDGGDGDDSDDSSEDSSSGGDSDGDDSGTGEGSGGDSSDGAGSVMGDCPTGEFVDGPADSPDGSESAEADWQIATEQAMRVAMKAGHMPGCAELEVKKTRASGNDWRTELREFVANSMPTDQSWARPNRRYVGSGLYLPGQIRDNVGELVAVIDVSGSIYGDILEAFGGCLTSILQDARPEKIHVIYVDTRVCGVDEFTADDPEVLIRTTGGGGTMFQPAFDWVTENDVNPIGLIYLTDLECYDSPQEPGYPVLWLTPEYVTLEGRFGRTIRIEETSL